MKFSDFKVILGVVGDMARILPGLWVKMIRMLIIAALHPQSEERQNWKIFAMVAIGIPSVFGVLFSMLATVAVVVILPLFGLWFGWGLVAALVVLFVVSLIGALAFSASFQQILA